MPITHTIADVVLQPMRFDIIIDPDKGTATGVLSVPFKSIQLPPNIPPLTMQIQFSQAAQLAAIFTPARITALRDMAIQKAIDLLNQKTTEAGPTLA